MNVRELLAALQDLDPELEVQAEGCQFCMHRVIGVHGFEGNPRYPERDVVLEIDAP